MKSLVIAFLASGLLISNGIFARQASQAYIEIQNAACPGLTCSTGAYGSDDCTTTNPSFHIQDIKGQKGCSFDTQHHAIAAGGSRTFADGLVGKKLNSTCNYVVYGSNLNINSVSSSGSVNVNLGDNQTNKATVVFDQNCNGSVKYGVLE